MATRAMSAPRDDRRQMQGSGAPGAAVLSLLIITSSFCRYQLEAQEGRLFRRWPHKTFAMAAACFVR